MTLSYPEFLKSKSTFNKPSGFDPVEINPMLFNFQRDIVRWACRRGRAAIFADCGLGKTPMQLEWARLVCEQTGGNCLILAPLAVSYQTKREGEKFGISVTVCKDQSQVIPGINVTNYEKLEHFSPCVFSAVVLDESSILKSYTGKFRTKIIEEFQETPYRLACSATPAPNDYMELGNHAEFLGIMSRTEMLSMFFTHDGVETSKWRLKGHAESEFWKWMASWAVYMRKPSDLGYSDSKFQLPALEIQYHLLESTDPTEGYLFPMPAVTLEDQRKVKRASLEDRVKELAEMVNKTDDSWLIWCELNNESRILSTQIQDCQEITGSDSQEFKEESLIGFASGEIKRLVTKPSIAGFGMNFQICHRVAYVSISHSYESFYQSLRRCWRFGQQNQVDVHVFLMENEQPILHNLIRKEAEASRMSEGILEHMTDLNKQNIQALKKQSESYSEKIEYGSSWEINLGDSVQICHELESESIDYSIFSPPFASLYTYSNSDRDMGNCTDYETFSQHFEFLVEELYRLTRSGRLLSFHCFNIPFMKERDGFIGLRDFRGLLIAKFQKYGWIFHSEVCIWKDPVTAMQRTKSIGLLYKQLKKDSNLSRQGIPDYVVTMRKPGENLEPVIKDPKEFPVSLWQRYASPIWMDINPSKTLQSIREEKDERHICPLQLEVIGRCIALWTNPNDLILDPFAGIGSTGYVAIQQGRRFLGIELKESYYNQAIKNLRQAEQLCKRQTLFDLEPLSGKRSLCNV